MAFSDIQVTFKPYYERVAVTFIGRFATNRCGTKYDQHRYRRVICDHDNGLVAFN